MGSHIVVNNAGITRDRMLFNMSDEDWDAVIAVHLRGHFLLTRNAATYWRAKAKEGDGAGSVYGRIINTSSEAGLAGPVGQANYGAAKAGITALTLTAARALERYGVRANAIAPRATHRDDGRRVRRGTGTRRGADRQPFARARRLARSLPRVAGIRRRQRAGVHRVRTDGDAAGGADRRAAIHRRRRRMGARRAERNAARVLC